jgi:hypothetical protein
MDKQFELDLRKVLFWLGITSMAIGLISSLLSALLSKSQIEKLESELKKEIKKIERY